MTHETERANVIATARSSVALGLTHGTSGNVSCRVPGGMLITPTGLAYDGLTPGDIVAMGLGGVVLPGEQRLPSSEWRLHAALYRARPDIEAVVHCHSPAATALSCLDRELPAFHYMIAIAGGDSVRCASYALFGSEELAAGAVTAMYDRWACLLSHHGQVTGAPMLQRALAIAAEVEFLADIYLKLLPLGEPERLRSDQMSAVLERFQGYGQ